MTDMQHTKPGRRRVAVKQASIHHDLHQQIVRGDLRPGEQLPPRTDIERRFGASRVTIQRVFDQLREDGFVATDGRAGTRVAERPPHLHRYGLVFPEDVPGWSRFWHALHNHARVLGQGGTLEIVTFAGVDLRRGNRAYEALLREVQMERFAGIIFAAQPGPLVDTPVFVGSHIAKVALMSGPPHPGLPAIYPSYHSLIDRGLDHLHALGRRRVAMVVLPGTDDAHVAGALAARGMDQDPALRQAVHAASPEWARNCVHMLCDRRHRDPVDALFVVDDNLAEHAMAGVLASGARVPDDVSLLVHANFPRHTPSVLPARRIGFDAARILEQCLETLCIQRRGEQPRMETLVSASFEDEVITPGGRP